MRTDQMQQLISINKTGSITSASKELFLSPQALSASIRALEKELGYNILHRSSTGVRFTSKGFKLLLLSKRFLNEMSLISEDLMLEDEPLEKMQGEMAFYSTGALLNSVLPSFFVQSYQSYPKIRITTHENETNEIIRLILSGEARFGIITREYVEGKELYPWNQSIDFISLLSGHYIVLTCDRKDPIYQNKTISMKNFLKKPIGLFHSSYIVLQNIFNLYGGAKDCSECYHHSILFKSIQSGLNSTLGLRLDNTLETIPKINDAKEISFREKIRSSIGLIYLKDINLTPLEKNYIDFLKSFYEDYLNVLSDKKL